jgi:hypothetical protein
MIFFAIGDADAFHNMSIVLRPTTAARRLRPLAS